MEHASELAGSGWGSGSRARAGRPQPRPLSSCGLAAGDTTTPLCGAAPSVVIGLIKPEWRRATPSSASFIPTTLPAMTWVLLAGATGTTMDG